MASAVVVSISEFMGEIVNKDMPPMKYSVKFPQFDTNIRGGFIARLNKLYLSTANTLSTYCQKRLFTSAIKHYNGLDADSLTIYAFELYSEPTITLNANNLLSLYVDRFTYDGGANGSTVRRSDSWLMNAGRRLQLSDLFPPGFNYRAYIEAEVIKQIQEQVKEGANFFEDYPKLVHQYFDPRQFYLTEAATAYGLAVYYQEITIAPHVSGIISFNIPTDNLVPPPATR